MYKIGIVGSRNEHGNFFGAPTTYCHWIKEALDGIPVIIMPDDEVRTDIDLLILPGGMDTRPSLYGESPSFHAGNHDVFKQHFYDVKLPEYVASRVPIFGICLGFQMLNVYFGGSLDQHVPHHQSSERYKESHQVVEVYLEGDTLVYTGKKAFGVNSHHHQVVRKYQVADELEIKAFAKPEEGPVNSIVEAFKHKSLPIAGVQWHPEEFFDSFSTDLILSLLPESKLV